MERVSICFDICFDVHYNLGDANHLDLDGNHVLRSICCLHISEPAQIAQDAQHAGITPIRGESLARLSMYGIYSRMRSEGFFNSWGSGGRALFAIRCFYVRNRPQPFATVRNRPQPSAVER